MQFHDTFDSSYFTNRYKENFGLSPISFSEFNTVVRFAIIDIKKFSSFEQEIDKFIANSNPSINVNYNTDIKFIKRFDFVSTDKIVKYQDFYEHVIINLVESIDIFNYVINPVEQRLLEYLTERGYNFYSDLNIGCIEILNASQDIVIQIADNFDIIQSINSLLAGIVRPNRFNIPERTFGFNIANPDENLPIIGIIDTGISNQNPLAPLIISDPNFDLTRTSTVIDNANHGTAVGALAALGTRLIPSHLGDFVADARLLPIKILDSGIGAISELEIIRLIRDAYEMYGVQIYTLTICYTGYKKYNDIISEYAYALDVLSYELNILIFISVANNKELMTSVGLTGGVVTYPNHFEDENSNLCSPSESMNNITIGAVADNLENNTLNRVSPPGVVPAIYSRTFHIDWNHPSMNKTRVNKKLFKPDVCNYGGDYNPRLDPSNTGMKIISSTLGTFYDRDAGTSLSTPLTANLAAKLIKRYPSLADNMQTIKALIINSAYCPNREDLFNLPITKQSHVLGNGVPNEEECEVSSSDRITFILEDEISPGYIKSFPIHFPEYLLDLNRKGVLTVQATMCFKFKPVKNDQLTYCPIQIAFGLFKNKPLEEYELDENGAHKLENEKPISIGINNNKAEYFTFGQSWSQDYYFKAKMLSNSQKINFTLSKDILRQEGGTLKIALNCKLHKMLTPVEAQHQNIPHKFSLVITFKENSVKNINTGRLLQRNAEY
ncbi:MAG: S8 family peptidase [Sphingobacteriaceae bacterium]|nr:S8 family peptidase [Sphingobacteriaceae bacterium]